MQKINNKLLGRRLDATEKTRSYEFFYNKTTSTLRLKIYGEIGNQINIRIETPIMNNVVSLFV